MRTGRSDYDAIFRETSLPTNEPRFILRAQDLVGAAAVRSYVQLAKSAGADEAFLEMAASHADAMEAWPKKKLPDIDLTPASRKQLAYAWGRREWNRGEFSAEAIAEARGFERGVALMNGAPLDPKPASGRPVCDEDWDGRFLLGWWRGARSPDVVQFVDGEWQDERGVIFAAPDVVMDIPPMAALQELS